MRDCYTCSYKTSVEEAQASIPPFSMSVLIYDECSINKQN